LVGLFRISRVCGEKVNLPEKRHQPQKGNDVIQRNPSCKVISANAIDGSSELNPDSIHVVVMSSFLEHECRPLSLLKQFHPILKSKGVIILKVPNFACWNRIIRGRKWCGFRYPDHVNYFTPRTLQRPLRRWPNCQSNPPIAGLLRSLPERLAPYRPIWRAGF